MAAQHLTEGGDQEVATTFAPQSAISERAWAFGLLGATSLVSLASWFVPVFAIAATALLVASILRLRHTETRTPRAIIWVSICVSSLTVVVLTMLTLVFIAFESG